MCKPSLWYIGFDVFDPPHPKVTLLLVVGPTCPSDSAPVFLNIIILFFVSDCCKYGSVRI